MDLTKYYDDLKSELDNGISPTSSGPSLSTASGEEIWKNKAFRASQELSDKCRKHILVDIYCKIIPLDGDYVANNQGVMKGDIDNMLTSKGMTATQYFKSCSEQTKAPLVEFVIRSTDNIGKQFLEEANETLKDAQENKMDVPTPEVPDIDEDENVKNQLIDIKQDPEYEAFMNKLQEETGNKIVGDITKLLLDKKKDKELSFDPKPVSERVEEMESSTSIGLEYLQKKMIVEGVEAGDELFDEMMGMAIRESTLNIIDSVFKQPNSDFKSFNTMIRRNKGIVINEAASSYFIEAAKSAAEVEKVIDDANKGKDQSIDSKLTASEVVNAAEEKGKENKDQK